MKKAVVYSTTTGNTEAMANAVAEGVKKSGAELIMTTADSADADAVLAADVLILGSPAMGDEVLEDTMEEFFTSIEGKISGKKVAIFGSYDWGDGQWMRDWQERVEGAGASMICDGIIANGEPSDDSVIDELKSMGSNAALA